MRKIVSLMASLLLCNVMSIDAKAHDIYTGVRGKTGMLCCGGNDCFATHYRLIDGHYEFLKKDKNWVEIPAGRIIFLPIPGDDASEDPDPDHRAHMCYRSATDYDRLSGAAENVFDDIYLYCAFIPPSSTSIEPTTKHT